MSFNVATSKIGTMAAVFSSGAAMGILFDRKVGFGSSKLTSQVEMKAMPMQKVKTNEDSKFLRAQEIFKYGHPEPLVPQIIYYENHVLEFDPQKRTPKWVAEHITKTHIEPVEVAANRKLAKFKPDPDIPKIVSADNEDFWDSGWSRGHMAPAGNNKHCQKSMNETFYLTNIVPQDLDNNGDFWNRLEIYCRDLTKVFSDVRVISGPIWRPIEENESNETCQLQNGRKKKPHKIMKYPVIGKSEVSVPTHLYKIVLVEDSRLKAPLMSAFIVPNLPIPRNKSLKEFQVSLEDIESALGVRFHTQLDRARVGDLCDTEGCHMMDYRTFQTFFVRRNIKSARNFKELERAWKKAVNLELVDPELSQLRESKISEFSESEAGSKKVPLQETFPKVGPAVGA